MSELIPTTRALPAVLRDALQNEGVRLVVGKVVSIPDNAHVRVEFAGTQVTIPRLASYQAPVAGDAVYCLATGSVMIAVGIATPTPRGGAAVDPGTATGQVPVWNAATGRWTGQAQAPNADALDGLDSSAFLQQTLAGTHRAWWTFFSGVALAGGISTHAHPLGVVPTGVFCLPQPPLPNVGYLDATTTQVRLRWWLPSFADATGTVFGFLLVLG
jgi:hypothetical protein